MATRAERAAASRRKDFIRRVMAGAALRAKAAKAAASVAARIPKAAAPLPPKLPPPRRKPLDPAAWAARQVVYAATKKAKKAAARVAAGLPAKPIYQMAEDGSRPRYAGPDDYRKARLATQARWRRRQVAKGLCSHCLEPLSLTSVWFCQRHLDANTEGRRARYAKVGMTEQAAARARAAAWVASGLCGYCGDEPIAHGLKRSGDLCAIKRRKQAERRRERTWDAVDAKAMAEPEEGSHGR